MEMDENFLSDKAMKLFFILQLNIQELMVELNEFLFLEGTNDCQEINYISHKKYSIIDKNQLDHLRQEVSKITQLVPAVLKPAVSFLPQLTQAEKDLVALKNQKVVMERERDNLIQRVEGCLVDYEEEKQEKFQLKCLYTEVNRQLQQQVEYCSLLGSVCGNLLWRTSQNEDSIQNLLSGSKINDFLQLVVSTVHSYLTTYQDQLPDTNSQETQFVLSLCGTVTNIAASAYGREYMSTCPDGQNLIENMIDLLAIETDCYKLKSLILMLLYNISINQKGLTILRGQPELLKVLVWLARESTDDTVKMYSLQLFQSLILEPLTATLIHQALEAVDLELFQRLSTSRNHNLKQVADELIVDVMKLHHPNYPAM